MVAKESIIGLDGEEELKRRKRLTSFSSAQMESTIGEEDAGLHSIRTEDAILCERTLNMPFTTTGTVFRSKKVLDTG